MQNPAAETMRIVWDLISWPRLESREFSVRETFEATVLCFAELIDESDRPNAKPLLK